jgi:hypothetical protein
MSLIRLHPIDQEFAQYRLERAKARIARLLNVIQEQPGELDALYEAAWQYVGGLAALNPQSPEILQATKIASQAIATIFAQITTGEDRSINVSIGEHSSISFPGLHPHPSANAGLWIEGFYFSAISRDTSSLGYLISTPTDFLFQSSTRTLSCTNRQVEVLKAYWTGENDFGSCLATALAATDPDQVREEAQAWSLPAAQVNELVKYTLMITVPELQLLINFVEQDTAQFNATLQQALELHREYWQADNQLKQIQDSKTFIALGPLAMAALAYANDMEIRVESDYLPPVLYRGR